MLTTLSKITIILGTIATCTIFPQTTIAQTNSEHFTKQAKRCTPQTCTPYRLNYERAITRGIIRRPSGVPDESVAIKLADEAVAKGDKNEAAIRLAQALVIMSEKTPQGTTNAQALERSLDQDVRAKHKQSLRAYLPLFGRIFPTR